MSKRIDIDDWLKNSADNGHVPVTDGDWGKMQLLLDEDNQRKPVAFWWIAAALIPLIAGLVWLLNFSNSANAPTIAKAVPAATTTKASPVKDATISTNHSTSTTTIEKNNFDTKENTATKAFNQPQKNLLIANSKSNVVINHQTFEEKSHQNSTIKKSYTQKGKTKSTISEGNIAEIESADSKAPNVLENVDVSVTKSEPVEAKTQEQQVLQEELTKPVSLNEKPVAVIVDVKKNEQKDKAAIHSKARWLDFMIGSETNQVDGGKTTFVTVGYGVKIGSKGFFVQPALGAGYSYGRDSLSYTSIQRSSKNLRNTMMFVIDSSFTITTVRPNNSPILIPQLNVGFEKGRWQMVANMRYGFAINSKTSQLSTTSGSTSKYDSIAYPNYTSPVININRYNGDKYISAGVGINYSIIKMIYFNMGYNRQLWRSSYEGLANGRKKSWGMQIGLGFRF